MPDGGMMGEGMGRPIAVTAEKNKTVIRNIDWVPGTGTVSPAGAGPFQQALIQAGAAVLQAGGSYRLDLYMDKQSPDAAAKSLGSYTMVSCAVAPGFEFADFELLAERAELAAELARALPEAVGFL